MECPFALGIMWQCSGKPSHFALKTIINRFPNERHNPLLKAHKADHEGLFFLFLELGLRDCAAPKRRLAPSKNAPKRFCVTFALANSAQFFALKRNTACNTAPSLLSGFMKALDTPPECPFALGIMWQCSGKPSHFALKTIINRFLNERHNPPQLA